MKWLLSLFSIVTYCIQKYFAVVDGLYNSDSYGISPYSISCIKKRFSNIPVVYTRYQFSSYPHNCYTNVIDITCIILVIVIKPLVTAPAKKHPHLAFAWYQYHRTCQRYLSNKTPVIKPTVTVTRARHVQNTHEFWALELQIWNFNRYDNHRLDRLLYNCKLCFPYL